MKNWISDYSNSEVHGPSIAGHTGYGARRKRGRVLSKPWVATLLFITALLSPSNAPKQFGPPNFFG